MYLTPWPAFRGFRGGGGALRCLLVPIATMRERGAIGIPAELPWVGLYAEGVGYVWGQGGAEPYYGLLADQEP